MQGKGPGFNPQDGRRRRERGRNRAQEGRHAQRTLTAEAAVPPERDPDTLPLAGGPEGLQGLAEHKAEATELTELVGAAHQEGPEGQAGGTLGPGRSLQGRLAVPPGHLEVGWPAVSIQVLLVLSLAAGRERKGVRVGTATVPPMTKMCAAPKSPGRTFGTPGPSLLHGSQLCEQPHHLSDFFSVFLIEPQGLCTELCPTVYFLF